MESLVLLTKLVIFLLVMLPFSIWLYTKMFYKEQYKNKVDRFKKEK